MVDARTRRTLSSALPAVPLLASLLVPISCISSLADQDIVLTDQQLNDTILPHGLDRQLPPDTPRAQVLDYLRNQPNLVLDHTTLEITAPEIGRGRALMVNKLLLKNGAIIRLRGNNLEVDALIIDPESGGFEGFPKDEKAGTADAGHNGSPGLNAGNLVLNSEIKPGTVLRVTLQGQPGQNGGAGQTGPAGVAGIGGEGGADHLFDCAHGGGNGGTGSPGGSGGNGGDGGAGGNGGRLILRGPISEQRAQIDFAAPSGPGGEGGAPGKGGPGGPGGPGGRGTTYCHGGVSGRQGLEGPPGSPGVHGNEGLRGSITAD